MVGNRNASQDGNILYLDTMLIIGENTTLTQNLFKFENF